MKKNLLKKFFMFLFMGTSMYALQACSDDDDENGGGSSNTNVGEVVPGSGKKLLSAGDFKFHYGSNGKLKYVREGDDRHEFLSNQVVSYYDYYYDEYDTDKEVINFSYNGKGYISKMHESETWDDDGETGSYTSTMNLSYDGEGHLTKVTGKYSEEEVEDGETWKEEGTATINLTWNNGLLVKYEATTLYDDGWKYKETATFDYEDREYTNRHHQYAPFIENLLGEVATIFAYVGLFGEGPDYLPANVTYEEVELYEGEEDYYWDEEESYTYDFNDDGTIYRVNSDYFTYGEIDEQGEIDEYQSKATRAEKPQKRSFMFGSRLKKHNR